MGVADGHPDNPCTDHFSSLISLFVKVIYTLSTHALFLATSLLVFLTRSMHRYEAMEEKKVSPHNAHPTEHHEEENE